MGTPTDNIFLFTRTRLLMLSISYKEIKLISICNKHQINFQLKTILIPLTFWYKNKTHMRHYAGKGMYLCRYTQWCLFVCLLRTYPTADNHTVSMKIHCIASSQITCNVQFVGTFTFFVTIYL